MRAVVVLVEVRPRAFFQCRKKSFSLHGVLCHDDGILRKGARTKRTRMLLLLFILPALNVL